jgi:hypothetical protein
MTHKYIFTYINMSGIMMNGIKYMCVNDNNDFNKNSLEDKLYFILRGIFWNAISIETLREANDLNLSLTGRIHFENITDNYKYTNVLYEIDYIKRLQRWLKQINHYYFEFEEPEVNVAINNIAINIDNYMKLDDWWVQFEELRNLIDEQYANITK